MFDETPIDTETAPDPIAEMMGLAESLRLQPRHTGEGKGLGDALLAFMKICFADSMAQLTAEQKQVADDIQDCLNESIQIYPESRVSLPPGSHNAVTDSQAAAAEKTHRRAVDAGEAEGRPPAW